MKLSTSILRTLSGLGIIAVALLTAVIWLFSKAVRIIGSMASQIR